MHHRRASSKPEVDDHPGGKPVATHHHHSGGAQASTLSAKERLIVRLRQRDSPVGRLAFRASWNRRRIAEEGMHH